MRALAVVTGLSLILPLAAQAPAGFRTVKDPASGLEYHSPKEYSEIPLAPTEMVLRARLQHRRVPEELLREKVELKPSIYVFLFRERPTSVTGTPAAAAAPAAEDDDVPSSFRELMLQRSDVGSLDQFLSRRLEAFEASRIPEREGHYDLKPKQPGRGLAVAGYAIVKRKGAWVMGAYGVTAEPHLGVLKGTLAKVAASLKLRSTREREEDERSLERELDRLYGSGRFRAAEQRRNVRRGLARGWEAQDTENYIIVHHSEDERLINKVSRDIEAMRAVYERTFPPVKPVLAVNVVRICRNRGEYLAYGGSPTSGGYWHPGNEELVLYDYDQSNLDGQLTGGRRTTDRDSLLVLYHEAFHQYIHYAVGEIAPHDWFNEGHGDYFSGAMIPQNGRTVSQIGPSRWRLHRAKDQLKDGKGRIDLPTLLRAERPQFYDPVKAPDFYAAAWSFVFFLRESPEAREHPRWSQLLDRYFKDLTTAYQEELQGKGEAPDLNARMAAGAIARQRAISATLEGLDLAELAASWEKFIVRLRDPWPELRAR